jgi:hypothetical protein
MPGIPTTAGSIKQDPVQASLEKKSKTLSLKQPEQKQLEAWLKW